MKLEEYLSRRNGKAFESGKDASAIVEDKKSEVSASEVVSIAFGYGMFLESYFPEFPAARQHIP